jgi:hypothetical protein
MAFDWNNLGTGLLSAGLNLYKSGAGVDAANAQLGNVQGQDAQRRAAYNTYAAQLAGLAPSIEAGFSMKPATAKTGFATSSIDPATGKIGYTLDPRAQGMFDQYLAGAKSSLDLAGGLDPKAHAAERLAAQQALLAPRRAAEDAANLRKLQAKGLLGSGSFATGLPGGTAANPLLAATEAARSQADAESAYRSLSEGEAYLDRLLGRSKGMLGGAQGIDAEGAKALDMAGRWTDRFTSAEKDKTRTTADLLGKVFGAQRTAAYDDTAAQRILAAQSAEEKAKLARTGGLVDQGSKLLSSAGGISGMLGMGKDLINSLFGGSSGSWGGVGLTDPFQGWSSDVALSDLDPTIGFGTEWNMDDLGGDWNLGEGWGW